MSWCRCFRKSAIIPINYVIDGDYGARSDDKTFDVIDRQRRLATISVIVLAVLKNLQRLVDNKHEAEANQRPIELIRVLA